MPELPEVETIRRGLEPILVGNQIAGVDQRRPDLRFPFPDRFASRLYGRMINRLERRAKYLLAHIQWGDILVMHLGMSGRFTVERPGAAPEKTAGYVHDAGTDPAHDHVIFRLIDGTVLRYNDARRFGYMDLIPDRELATHKLFKDLGVEPLCEELSAEYLAGVCKGRRTSVKAILTDQHVIAGLGNIYACEALHRARIAPARKAATLCNGDGTPNADAEHVVDAIKAVLTEAIEAGGSTLRDYRHADGSLGLFQHAFAVYDREGEGCPRPGCGGTVARIMQTGRSTFHCPSCQT